MKISAMVAEFNPFHNGHRYILSEMKKKTDAAVVIMSGNFVQRGECSVFDKYSRAQEAIKGGADLVLELPAVYALSSAENFAKGSVLTLNALGYVDELWFGSECGNTELLKKSARILAEESNEFSRALNASLTSGASFASARQIAFEACGGEKDILKTPNNILAIEYIRVILKNKINIAPVTVKRIGSSYNDECVSGEYPSATAIRKQIKNNAYAQKNGVKPLFMQSFDTIVCAKLKTASADELCCIPDCNSELASRLVDASGENTFEEIVNKAVCKRYTQSRIRRILCNLIINNKFAYTAPQYIRPLAFNAAGAEIIKKAKDIASLPIVPRGAVLKDNPIFKLECRATDMYNLAGGSCPDEFSACPVICD